MIPSSGAQGPRHDRQHPKPRDAPAVSRHNDGFAFGRTTVPQAVDAFFADMEIGLR